MDAASAARGGGAELDLTLTFVAALCRFELASIAASARDGSVSDRVIP
jgi:hypothetical protein